MGRHALVVELLLFHGASVDILNKRQYTAVDCAEPVRTGAAPCSLPHTVDALCSNQTGDHNSQVTVLHAELSEHARRPQAGLDPCHCHLAGHAQCASAHSSGVVSKA